MGLSEGALMITDSARRLMSRVYFHDESENIYGRMYFDGALSIDIAY